jgi:hypothetical protein
VEPSDGSSGSSDYLIIAGASDHWLALASPAATATSLPVSPSCRLISSIEDESSLAADATASMLAEASFMLAEASFDACTAPTARWEVRCED